MQKNTEKRIRRRDALKLLAAGIATATAAEAQTPPKPADAEEALTVADLAAADKITAHNYTDEERKLMLKSVTDTRKALKELRAVALDQTCEPATRFDPRLPETKVPTGKSSCRPSRGKPIAYSGNLEALAFASAVELSRLIHAQKITSVALTKMYLERLKRHRDRLLCVVTLMEGSALRQAEQADKELAAGKSRGPLHGIPWGAKDLFATRDAPTTWGAKPYAEQKFDYDSTVVERLAAAGAVLVAKLTMGELAMGDVWFGGKTRNPWKPEQGSSGSSAGSGSATAAGLVGFAVGTETLGSIVSPSVVNGVTGLRPTYGRISRYGAMPLCWTMDKVGPMARAVEDCALVLSVLHGPDGRDSTVADVPFRWDANAKLSSLRVGIDKAAFDRVNRNEKRKPIYDAAQETLKKLGVELRPVTLPRMTPAYNALAGLIIDVESAAAFTELTQSGKVRELVQQAEGSWPNTFRAGSTVPASDYIIALRVRARLQREMAAALKDVDVVVTVPNSGPAIFISNLTGQPTLVTRCGLLDGMPQSIEFLGNLYGEAAILRLALAFEQATDWHKQWPEAFLPPR
jgi:Asp-tRNA(Asn)/Glu-tRNA(Gln) amidotransferase A subunit family amidase